MGIRSLGDAKVEKCLDPSVLEDVFVHLSGGADTLRVKSLHNLFTRPRYRVVSHTPLTTSLHDTKQRARCIRLLNVGEVVEALQPPVDDVATSVKRMYCRAVQDGTIGWASVTRN